MILLDNSEFMRNGDYIPTRLEAQQDAANLLVGAKTQSHPESTVGVSAGTELLVSPTDDVGKILIAIHGLSMQGKVTDVTACVQVASLALKHRVVQQNHTRFQRHDYDNYTACNNRSMKRGRQIVDTLILGCFRAERKTQEKSSVIGSAD